MSVARYALIVSMRDLSDSTLAQTYYSVSEVRSLDRAAIDEFRVSGYELMTRAAKSVLNVARERYPSASRWEILCGGGNNGGDGYVLARLAAAEDIDVRVIALTQPDLLSGDAGRAYRDFVAAGGSAGTWTGSLAEDRDLLIDALLGSGLERDVGGDFATSVAAMNRHAAPVIALDIPTGLHGDTGTVMGCAARADVTVTFVGRKVGLVVGDGPVLAGSVHFFDLGIPEACYQRVAGVLRGLGPAARASLLPPRPREAHKNSFGHVLVVGGGLGMPGAVILAGTAALRAGAGLVNVATRDSHTQSVVGARPELMSLGVNDPDSAAALLEAADVIVLGPGLGQDAWAEALFELVLDSGKPMVLDADALNLLARSERQGGDWVLTPHPGEAARLLGIAPAEIQASRLEALEALQARYGGTVVLKGAGTLTHSGDGLPWICNRGNPGMASPGMGDALTGIVAALRAQGLNAEAAAALGVEIHAHAGDCASRGGERGLLASDLIEEIRACVNP
ncbi:MAG: NAD(P)H-hydrate dehydratase [Pseudomonadota bacterium]